MFEVTEVLSAKPGLEQREPDSRARQTCLVVEWKDRKAGEAPRQRGWERGEGGLDRDTRGEIGGAKIGPQWPSWFLVLTQGQKLQFWAVGPELGVTLQAHCLMFSHRGSLMACREEAFSPCSDSLHSVNPEPVLCKSCKLWREQKACDMFQYAGVKMLTSEVCLLKSLCGVKANWAYVSRFLERPCFQDQSAVCLLYWADRGHSGAYIMPETSVVQKINNEG